MSMASLRRAGAPPQKEKEEEETEGDARADVDSVEYQGFVDPIFWGVT